MDKSHRKDPFWAAITVFVLSFGCLMVEKQGLLKESVRKVLHYIMFDNMFQKDLCK